MMPTLATSATSHQQAAETENINRAFRHRLAADTLITTPPHPRHPEPNTFRSIRGLVGGIMVQAARDNIFFGVQSTLGRMLDETQIRIDGAPISMHELLTRSLVHTAREITRSWSAADTVPMRELAEHFMRILIDTIGEQPLGSFFYRPRNAWAMFEYRDDIEVDEDLEGKATVIPCAGGETIHLYHTKCADGDCFTFKAHNWLAELRADGELRATCLGMVYTARRLTGVIDYDTSFVVDNDEIDDRSVFLAEAFTATHPDRIGPLLKKAGVATVNLWERPEDAPRGAGMICLTTALKALKTRFKTIGHIIINTTPLQFAGGATDDEPPAIQFARKRAIERLHAHVTKHALHECIGAQPADVSCVQSHFGPGTDAMDIVRHATARSK